MYQFFESIKISKDFQFIVDLPELYCRQKQCLCNAFNFHNGLKTR